MLLQGQQHLVLAGCFTSEYTWLIRAGALPETAYLYTSNAHEADNRIWRHAIQTTANKILVCSPDTDVYNIGLSMPNNKDYIVQLNVHHSPDKKYLMLRHLNLAFQGDPDLQALPRDHLGSIVQSQYISTGCDYISYLKTFGKAKIINIFTQYASLFLEQMSEACTKLILSIEAVDLYHLYA